MGNELKTPYEWCKEKSDELMPVTFEGWFSEETYGRDKNFTQNFIVQTVSENDFFQSLSQCSRVLYRDENKSDISLNGVLYKVSENPNDEFTIQNVLATFVYRDIDFQLVNRNLMMEVFKQNGDKVEIYYDPAFTLLNQNLNSKMQIVDILFDSYGLLDMDYLLNTGHLTA